MPVLDLREALEDAENRHIALGHFNFSELVVLKAVADTARQLQLPVVVGVSEGEREFVGVRQAAALVNSLREEYELPIFLNADHTHSLEKSVEAAKAGFDLIVFDASNQPFEENVNRTKEAVEAAKSIKDRAMYQLDCGIAGEHLVLQAAELGLGTCWIGWFNRRAARRALGVPWHVQVVALISVGYPRAAGAQGSSGQASPRRRPRKPLSSMLWLDSWGNGFPGAEAYGDEK